MAGRMTDAAAPPSDGRCLRDRLNGWAVAADPALPVLAPADAIEALVPPA